MGGRFLSSYNGYLLGYTYFMVYRNASFTEATKSLGVNFKRYDWQTIPVEHQRVLEQMGLKAEQYDVGKVFNLIMQHHGAQMAFVPLPNLVHVGAMSYSFFRRPPAVYKVRKMLPSPVAIYLRALLDKPFRESAMDERRDTRSLALQREAIQRYLFLLLHEDGEHAARQYLKDLPQWLRQEVIKVGGQVQEIYRRYPLEGIASL
jgi:hypothetical protein